VLDVHRQFRVSVVVDPFQMARSIAYLRGQGVAIEEYVQSVPNLAKMATVVLELLRSRSLVLYPSAELREQALNATLVESAHGLRIAKEKASKKIDSLVALSMACVAAVAKPVLPAAHVW
jgi:phage terminase large subunit-like protein